MTAGKADLQSATMSKDLILNAALGEFARKGFDGARVDEIARRAGVNKALIYYYFKSKEGMLEALLNAAIEDMVGRFNGKTMDMEKAMESEAYLDGIFHRILGYIEGRRELFTIIMMELLKDSPMKGLILSRVSSAIIEEENRVFKLERGQSPAWAPIMQFFTGLLPIIMFVLLKDAWKDVYRVEEEELRAMFVESFKATHISFEFKRIKAGRENGQGSS